MSVSTFEVTAETVRTAYFPHWGAFSAVSKPTATQVGTFVTEEAADLGGKLALQSIDPASITSVTSPNGYAWCQKTLKLMVAVRVAKSATASNPELAKTLQADVDARLELLERYGDTILVDVTASSAGSPPTGPTTHISEFGLEVDDPDLMSSTRPRLRRDDKL